MQAHNKVSLDDLFAQIQEGNVKDLNIIVKADVVGSVEAVKQSLAKLSTDEVRIKIVHGAVGAITESDVQLASVSNAIIIGFNVRPGANVAEHAEAAGVDIRLYRVIYDAIDDIKAAMAGLLEPEPQGKRAGPMRRYGRRLKFPESVRSPAHMSQTENCPEFGGADRTGRHCHIRRKAGFSETL